MRKTVVFVALAVAFCALLAPALAVEVPALSPADFVVDASPEAHWIWSALAGTGIVGTVFYSLMRLLWGIAKPYADAWAARRKITWLMDAADIAARGMQQGYVGDIKAASADGKLTAAEAAEARDKAVAFMVQYMRAHGVDAVKEYGDDVLKMLIEWAVGNSKAGGLLKAVLPPLSAPSPEQDRPASLPDLQPLQPFGQ